MKSSYCFPVTQDVNIIKKPQTAISPSWDYQCGITLLVVTLDAVCGSLKIIPSWVTSLVANFSPPDEKRPWSLVWSGIII